MNNTPRRTLAALALAPLMAAVLALPAHAQSASPAPGKAKTTKAKTTKSKATTKAKGKAAPAPKPAATPAAPAASAAVPARAAAPAAPQQADYIVAVVNSEPVTNNEVRARMARAARQLQERGAPVPPADELRKAVLERLIAERAELQYARETGLKVDDSALAQAELSIARQNQLDSVEQLHQRIQQEGIPLKEFRDDIRNQVLLARLREREIDPRMKISAAEVDKFIREQTGAAPGGTDLNLAMILVAVPEGASPAEVARLKARADDVARRAKAGEDFGKLAGEFSEANNRGRDGGELGLRPADRYPELFQRSVARARVGEVVGPVQSAAGFHILKVIERKQNKDLPEVKIPQTHAEHILLKVGPTQSEQVAKERLADFKRRIQSGQATFEQLARQYSQDGSAAEGGDLGWVAPGQLVPEFEQAMNNLNPGQISEPVVSRFGVHLIRVEARREQVLTSAEQREMARNMLREKKAQEAFDAWAREVRGRAYVEYRDQPQ